MRDEWSLVQELGRSLSWCPQWHLVVTDTQATSTTEVLARLSLERPAEVVVHHVPLPLGESFDAARGAALKSVATEWVLILDTDERVPLKVVEALAQQALSAGSDIGGFWLPRRNHVLGVPLNAPASWPDWQLRLVRRDAVTFPEGIHQKYRVQGRAVQLGASDDWAIRHYSFRSNEQFLEKLQTYTTIEARTGHSKPLTPTRALTAAARFLATNLVRMRGAQDGEMGVHFAVCWAFYRYMAHTKAWEQSRSHAQR